MYLRNELIGMFLILIFLLLTKVTSSIDTTTAAVATISITDSVASTSSVGEGSVQDPKEDKTGTIQLYIFSTINLQ